MGLPRAKPRRLGLSRRALERRRVEGLVSADKLNGKLVFSEESIETLAIIEQAQADERRRRAAARRPSIKARLKPRRPIRPPRRPGRPRLAGGGSIRRRKPGRGGLLTGEEVARLLRVDRQTVRLWAERGVLPFTTTPGGHRRYWRASVQRLQRQLSGYRTVEVAELFGVSAETIRRWAKHRNHYLHLRAVAFKDKTEYRVAKSEAHRLLRLRDCGLRPSGVALRLRVPVATVVEWIQAGTLAATATPFAETWRITEVAVRRLERLNRLAEAA